MRVLVVLRSVVEDTAGFRSRGSIERTLELAHEVIGVCQASGKGSVQLGVSITENVFPEMSPFSVARPDNVTPTVSFTKSAVRLEVPS